MILVQSIDAYLGINVKIRLVVVGNTDCELVENYNGFV